MAQGLDTRRLGAATAAVTAAGLAVNGLAYAVPLLGARYLEAGDLGALAAALALGALAAVPGLGLQTAVAVRTSRYGEVRARGVTIATAASAGGALFLATPVLTSIVHLSAWLPPLLAVTAVAVVLGSRWLGELQGAQRFHALAWGMGLLGVARYAGVIIGLATGAGVAGSLAVGAAVAWLILPLLAWLAHTRPHVVSHVPSVDVVDGDAPSLARGVVAASSATMAMLAIAYADLILARHYLPATDSGAYAVGSVLTKGALWAPAVVTVIALPRLARGSERTLRVAVSAVAVCGTVLVLAASLWGGLAVMLAGGAAYESVAAYAPLFAASGAVYALAFVFVNARIANATKRPAAPLWVAIVGLAVAVAYLEPPTIGRIVTCAFVTAVLTTAVLASLRRRRGEE